MKRDWSNVWRKYSQTPGTIRLNERSMEVFQSLIESEEGKISATNATFEQIMGYVSEKYRVSPAQLRGDNSMQNIARARHVLCYLATRSGYQLKFIGRELGSRHHSTIIHSRDRVNKFLCSNKVIKPFVEIDRQIIKDF